MPIWPLPQDSLSRVGVDAGPAADSLRQLLVEDSLQLAAMLARDDSIRAASPMASAGPPSATAVWLVLAVLATVVLGGIALLVWLVRLVQGRGHRP